MNLSMWIISSELANKYETIPLIIDGERNIESIRLFSFDGIHSSPQKYVYIGHSSDFFMGNSEDQIVLSSGYDMIFVEHTDIIEVMNDIILIFDKYREFDEELKRASTTSNPFQDMLDVIHGIFNCPMLFGQKDLRIFALTKQYSDSEVYDGWDEVKKYYTMPIKLINTTVAPDMTKYPDSIKTVAIPVSANEGKHFQYQIRSNVYCNKKLWGHFYIYYYNKVIPVSVIQLARYCADAYGALLDRITAKDGESKNEKYTFLIDLLDGKEVDEQITYNVAWQMGWNNGQKIRMYKIAFDDETNTGLFFDFMFMTVDASAQNEIVFPYKKSIIILAKDSGKELNELFLKVQRVMSNDIYHCGVSFPFEDLKNITYAYFQASFAIEKLKGETEARVNYAYYDDYAFAGLISYVRDNINYKMFIMPELVEMYEFDKQTGTEYYKTLFWLLVNNCHAAETAKQLFIHRNTLKYRIDKIMQMMKVDIYDNDIRAYLRLCYALMMEDYVLPDIKKEQEGYTEE